MSNVVHTSNSTFMRSSFPFLLIFFRGSTKCFETTSRRGERRVENAREWILMALSFKCADFANPQPWQKLPLSPDRGTEETWDLQDRRPQTRLRPSVQHESGLMHSEVQCFPLIVTLLGPEKSVTISNGRISRWFYSIKLSFWISYARQKLSQ